MYVYIYIYLYLWDTEPWPKVYLKVGQKMETAHGLFFILNMFQNQDFSDPAI